MSIHHKDGSYTKNNVGGETTTYNKDGSIREYTVHSTDGFFGPPATKTFNGDHVEINRQPGHGDGKPKT